MPGKPPPGVITVKKRPKYRVLKKNGVYYPQERGWVFWHHFTDIDYANGVIFYTDLEGAVNYIEAERRWHASQKPPDKEEHVVMTWDE